MIFFLYGPDFYSLPFLWELILGFCFLNLRHNVLFRLIAWREATIEATIEARENIFNSIWEKLDELTAVFNTWSLFNEFNKDIVLRKQLYSVCVEVNFKELLCMVSASLRRPEDVKMPRLALYTERGRCWEYMHLGLKLTYSLCSVWRIILCERRHRRGLPT